MSLGLGCFFGPVQCIAGNVAHDATSSIFNEIDGWVADSSIWAWHELGTFLASTSSPSVVTSAAQPEYAALLLVAPLVAACALLGNVLSSLRRSDGAAMVREILMVAPLLVLVIVAAPSFATLVLTLVNGLCGAASVNASSALSHLTVAASQFPAGTPSFAALLLNLAGVLGAVVLWFELVLRNAVLALLLSLSPVIFAAALWAPLRRLAIRLVETFVTVAFSKFVVVVALALGVSATRSSSGEVVITGIAVAMLATFTPYLLLRMVPLMESSALHALDGVRHHASAGAQRAAATASTAASMATGTPLPGPPSRPDDLGIGDFPAGPDIVFPEASGEPPVPPLLGPPQLRTGHRVNMHDDYGPVIGWHFDE